MINQLLSVYKKRHYFKKGKRFLVSGTYLINGDNFKLVKSKRESKDAKSWNFVKIRNKKTNLNKYSDGKFVIGFYKAKFILKDQIYFFLYNKNQYCRTEELYKKYSSYIFFKHPIYAFDKTNFEISVPIVDGCIYDDDKHSDMFLHLLMQQYNNERISEIRTIDSFENVPFYIQHGDCKNANIIWKNDVPTLIDLESVNSYPIFYDFFYYLLMTKGKNFPLSLNNYSHDVDVICSRLKIGNPKINNIDYFLSCYLTYLSSYASKKYPEKVIDFYFRWITYSGLEKYPILKAKIRELSAKLAKEGFKKYECVGE